MSNGRYSIMSEVIELKVPPMEPMPEIPYLTVDDLIEQLNALKEIFNASSHGVAVAVLGNDGFTSVAVQAVAGSFHIKGVSKPCIMLAVQPEREHFPSSKEIMEILSGE